MRDLREHKPRACVGASSARNYTFLNTFFFSSSRSQRVGKPRRKLGKESEDSGEIFWRETQLEETSTADFLRASR